MSHNKCQIFDLQHPNGHQYLVPINRFPPFQQVSANEEMELGDQPVPNYDEDTTQVEEGQIITEGQWNKRLNSFQKLVFMKMLMQEKVT